MLSVASAARCGLTNAVRISRKRRTAGRLPIKGLSLYPQPAEKILILWGCMLFGAPWSLRRPGRLRRGGQLAEVAWTRSTQIMGLPMGGRCSGSNRRAGMHTEPGAAKACRWGHRGGRSQSPSGLFFFSRYFFLTACRALPKLRPLFPTACQGAAVGCRFSGSDRGVFVGSKAAQSTTSLA